MSYYFKIIYGRGYLNLTMKQLNDLILALNIYFWNKKF